MSPIILHIDGSIWSPYLRSYMMHHIFVVKMNYIMHQNYKMHHICSKTYLHDALHICSENELHDASYICGWNEIMNYLMHHICIENRLQEASYIYVC